MNTITKAELEKLTALAFRKPIKVGDAYILDMLNAPPEEWSPYLEDKLSHIIRVRLKNEQT